MPHCVLPSKLLPLTLGHVKGTVFMQIIIICFVIVTMLIFLIYVKGRVFTQIIIICFVIMTMLIFLIATMYIFLIVIFFPFI